MMNSKMAFNIAVLALLIITCQGCSKQYFRSNYHDANKLLHDTKNIEVKPFLKAHLKNGDICILLDTWHIDTVGNMVLGTGKRYDFKRDKVFDGAMTIPIDSVAIFETNKKLLGTEDSRVAILTILAGVNVVIGILCLTNPKACFGSCPTFYLNDNNNFHYADAEGFSNAISPSMENFDIDALNNPPINNSTYSLTMKNEALETHCVNDIKLYACPRKDGERVYQSPGNIFYACENHYSLSKATGNEGDITALLSHDDREERVSPADENNLSCKEEIVLHFDNVKQYNDLGLIVNFRQTLMTTYFIYNAIAYMGDEVGDIFAKLESSKETKEKLEGGIRKEVGNIDVYTLNNQTNKWELQDGIYETGPIAINKQILPLKNTGQSTNITLKLVINKGLWRIDYVALTNIKESVKPIEIAPSSILNKGNPDTTALANINNTSKYLVSMPGSEYKFNFELPDQNQDYELFLYSKGYYLEWMREHWMKDKNLLKLREMVENPKKYLKDEAKNYKQYEATMNQEFWGSKIDTKAFTY